MAAQGDDILAYAGSAEVELSPVTVAMFLRRLALWTTVVAVCAVPSLIWAEELGYNHWGMASGVLVFAAIYTVCSCTRNFRAVYARPFVQQTLYVGFGTRVALALFFPAGMATDLVPGFVSRMMVEQMWSRTDFLGTLLTTMVQGTLLNVVIFLYMLLVYAYLRAPDRQTADGVTSPRSEVETPVRA